MAINYPSSLDNFPNPTSTDLLDNSSPTLDHWTQHANNNDAIEALEAKVGADGSAVTTSHDYKLSEVTSTDKAVGKSATQTLTNKTLTSPTITGATVTGSTLTTTSVNGVTLSTSDGASTFLNGAGAYTSPTAGDASYAAKGSVQGLTDAATSGLTISSGVISVNSGTSANNIVKLDASAKLPAVDGSQITGIVPLYQQEIPVSTSSSTVAATSLRITSETDGNTLYLVAAQSVGGSPARIQRFVRDTLTSQYYMTHDVSNNIAGGSAITGDSATAIAVLGSYVYVASHSSTTSYITRFDKADLTNATSITISGTAFGSGVINGFSDGTSLYFYTSANTYYRYTISGTTATNAATVTYTSGGTPSGAISDGTSVWLLTSGVFRKYAVAGGSSTASYTSFIDTYSAAYPGNGSMNLIITKSGILGYVLPYAATNATATVGTRIVIRSITQI